LEGRCVISSIILLYRILLVLLFFVAMFFCWMSPTTGIFVFVLTLGLLVPLLILPILATRYPSFLTQLTSLWQRHIGWIVILLGILVFATGIQGFMNKQKDQKEGFLIAIYETMQLFFLNASDEAALMEDAQTSDEPRKSPKATNSSSNETPREFANQQTSSPPTISHPPPKEVNRYIVWAEIYAVLFVLLLAIEAIGSFLYRSLLSITLFIATDHIIVCGYGKIGRAIVNSYLSMNSNSLSFTEESRTDRSLDSSEETHVSDDACRKPDRTPFRKRRRLVVIDNSMRLADIEWMKRHGVLLIQGDARDREILQEAQSLWASEIFVATGNDESNLEVMSQLKTIEKNALPKLFDTIRKLMDVNHSKPTVAYVHLLDQDTIQIARRRLGPRPVDMQRGQIRFKSFSSIDRTARILLREIVALPAVQEINRIPSPSNHPLHLVLVGFDKSSQALLLRLAELCHFANGLRTRVTIVDRNIREKAAAFFLRYPSFSHLSMTVLTNIEELPNPANVMAATWVENDRSIEWGKEPSSKSNSIMTVCNTTVDELIEVTDPRFVEKIKQVSLSNPATMIVFCREDGKDNFLEAELLKTRLRVEKIDCPVFAWLGGAIGFVGITSVGNSDEVHPFGLCTDAITVDEITDGWVEWLAQWLNYSFEQSKKQPECSESWTRVTEVFARLREQSYAISFKPHERDAFDECHREMQVYWDKMAEQPATCEAFRHSNLSAAAHAIAKLASVGLAVCYHKYSVQTPRPSNNQRERLLKLSESLESKCMEHNRWIAERLLGGWRYGEKKDSPAKKHPLLTAWGQLSEDDRKKDEDAVRLLVNLCLAGLLVVKDLDKAKSSECDSR
jgi:hypothetical protein